MTKEVLEKEAIAKYKTGSYPQLHPDHFAFIHGYLAGAEPREKRIEELEKENRNLRDNYELFKAASVPEIERLKNENAELKETLKTYNGCGDWDNDFHTCRVYLQHEELQMYTDQLTEATEIIKKYLAIGVGGKITQNYLDVTKEAEQFLNSEVEK